MRITLTTGRERWGEDGGGLVLARARYLDLLCNEILGIGVSMQLTKDLVAASATPLVLGILADGESYGYAILKQINDVSGGQLDWTDGLLYPLLHRLERLGHVEAEWRTPEGGRRRKYYRITDQGHRELATQRRQWETVLTALRGVWDASVQLTAVPAWEGAR
jgi:PadR family transcriptional regulator PadR